MGSLGHGAWFGEQAVTRQTAPHWFDACKNKGVQRMIDVLIELLHENKALKAKLASLEKFNDQ